MKNTLETINVKGKPLKIVIDYDAKLYEKSFIDDWGKKHVQGVELSEKTTFTVYLNGDLIGDGQSLSEVHRSNPNFNNLKEMGATHLLHVSKGATRGAVPLSADQADELHRMIEELKERAPADVLTYKKEQAEKERQNEIRAARNIVAKAEKQSSILSYKEEMRRRKTYNDIYNEGGDGFVEELVYKEEYEAALKTLEDAEHETEKRQS